MKPFRVTKMLVYLLLISSATSLAANELMPDTSSIDAYISAGKAPAYLRINLKGYNIRTSLDFKSATQDNVAFQSGAGSVVKVVSMEPSKDNDGAYVTIEVEGQNYYVFVPRGREKDFNFCATSNCFGQTLSDVVNMLGDGVTVGEDVAQQTCRESLGPVEQLAQYQDLGNIKVPVPELNREQAADTEEADAPDSSNDDGSLASMGVDDLTSKMAWDGVDNTRNWNKWLLAAIKDHGQNLTGLKKLKDKEQWCPNFNKLTERQKTEFWMQLIAGIAKKESKFHRRVVYNEATKHNDFSGPVNFDKHSMGLFQISYGSTKSDSYRENCKFDFKNDKHRRLEDNLSIYDPKKQIDCVVGMVNKLVGDDGRVGYKPYAWKTDRNGKKYGLYYGAARFWSTLRSTNKSGAPAVIKSIIKKRFKPCGL